MNINFYYFVMIIILSIQNFAYASNKEIEEISGDLIHLSPSITKDYRNASSVSEKNFQPNDKMNDSEKLLISGSTLSISEDKPQPSSRDFYKVVF